MAFFDIFTQLTKKKKSDSADDGESFVPTREDDAFTVSSGGIVSHQLMFDEANGTSDADNIDRWREMASRPEVDWAIQEILNEAVVTDYNKYPVDVELDEVDGISDGLKKRIGEEFKILLSLMNFNRNASDIFRQWFIDGRHYFHLVVDSNNQKNGVIAIRWIDPKSIKKIIETEMVKGEGGVQIEKIKNQYYLYTSYINPKRASTVVRTQQAIRVDPIIIAYSNSGLIRERPDGSIMSLSHLDKAVKASNQLRLLEDAIVIYRLSRAPERRVFYVDVGNLPKTKAEQYLNGIMQKFRTKMVYDSATGEVKDQRNNLSMVEDYWLPRREGGRGTEVTTLAGGQNLNQLEDVDYFYRKLFRALNIPASRLQSESTFNFGRGAEITREEVKFSKFISYLRSKFNETFIQMLSTQLIAKNIMSEEEFAKISSSLAFKWQTDSYWDELMFGEVWQSRINLLQQAEPFVGKYFSQEWIKTNILNLTESDIELMNKQINKEPKPVDDEQGAGFR